MFSMLIRSNANAEIRYTHTTHGRRDEKERKEDSRSEDELEALLHHLESSEIVWTVGSLKQHPVVF